MIRIKGFKKVQMALLSNIQEQVEKEIAMQIGLEIRDSKLFEWREIHSDGLLSEEIEVHAEAYVLTKKQVADIGSIVSRAEQTEEIKKLRQILFI